LAVTLYGRTVTTQVRTMRALWYTALREQPLQIVRVRDPTGKRRDEVFFCTAPAAEARFILEAYARRWCLEVTFHDAKQFLGFAEPQCQTPRAVQRTAPFALMVYDLVVLWFAEHVHGAAGPAWPIRPWYRHKTAPSFVDMLTALRGALGPVRFLEPASPPQRLRNTRPASPDGHLEAA
jgi:hypothetical protein